MWYCGVDVAYRWLSDWTRLQWALHTQRASPFSAVTGGDADVPKLLWDFLLGLCHYSFCRLFLPVAVHCIALICKFYVLCVI